MVFLAVGQARAGTHHLHIALPNDGFPARAVLVFQVARQRNGDNLHVVVRMLAEAHTPGHGVVVEHAQHAKIHSLGVVIPRKAERVVRIEPAVVGVPARIGAVQNGLCHGKVI